MEEIDDIVLENLPTSKTCSSENSLACHNSYATFSGFYLINSFHLLLSAHGVLAGMLSVSKGLKKSGYSFLLPQTVVTNTDNEVTSIKFKSDEYDFSKPKGFRVWVQIERGEI